MATQFSERPFPVRAYDLLATGTSNLQSVVLLLLRLSWGLIPFLSGYRHLQHIPDTVEYFRDDLHVPFPTLSVYVSAITELVGGLFLIIGFATRLVSVPLAFNFVVAILTAGKDRVHQALFGGDNFKRYNAGHLGGFEALMDDAAFPPLMLSLITLAFGAGKISVDYLLKRVVFHRYTSPPNCPSSGEVAVGPIGPPAGNRVTNLP